MSNEQPKQSLRDRKRAQTRARIEEAAIQLVLRDGLDAATVDAISERADVSPRTFFNYFESKDAAILGLQSREFDDEALRARIAESGDLDAMVSVVALVTTAMGVSERGGGHLHRNRVEIMRRHPEVLSGQFAQLNARRTLLAEYVAQMVDRDPRFRGDPDKKANSSIVLAICASGVRSAVEDWAQNTNVNDVHAPGSDELEAIEQRAVELIYNTLGRLA